MALQDCVTFSTLLNVLASERCLRSRYKLLEVGKRLPATDVRQQPVPVLQGTLWKQGARGITRAWKKRHFVLAFDNKMRYFAGSVEKGSIDLSVVQKVTIINSASHEFDIEAPGRTYHLRTSSPNLLNYWVNGILESMNALRKPAGLAEHEVEQIEAAPRSDRSSSAGDLLLKPDVEEAEIPTRDRMESAPVRLQPRAVSTASILPTILRREAMAQASKEAADGAVAQDCVSSSDDGSVCSRKDSPSDCEEGSSMDSLNIPGPPDELAPAPPGVSDDEADPAVLRERINELKDMYKEKCVQMATLNGHYAERLKALRMENDAKESELQLGRSFTELGASPILSRPPSLDNRGKTPQRGIVAKVKALYTFKARTENELSFDAQDEIVVYDKSDSGWWKGELDGKVGLFPQRFTVVVEHQQSLAKHASQLLINRHLSSPTGSLPIADSEASGDGPGSARNSCDPAAVAQEERELMRSLVDEVDRLQGELTTLSGTLLQVVGQVDGLSDDIVDVQTRNEQLVSDLDVAQAELAASHELVQRLRDVQRGNSVDVEISALASDKKIVDEDHEEELTDVVEANAILQQYRKRLREQAAEVERLQNEDTEKTRQVLAMVERLEQIETQYAQYLKDDDGELAPLPPRKPVLRRKGWVPATSGKQGSHDDGGGGGGDDDDDDDDSKASAPVWLPDVSAPVCYGCRSSFTVLRRRHHCRNCGKIFCASCTASKCSIAEFGYKKPVRVCDECLSSIEQASATPGAD